MDGGLIWRGAIIVDGDDDALDAMTVLKLEPISVLVASQYESVVAIEDQLDSIARDVGGYADEFGTYGNADDPKN